jgi:hypothetical protein
MLTAQTQGFRLMNAIGMNAAAPVKAWVQQTAVNAFQ